jgi:hypothetical protein
MVLTLKRFARRISAFVAAYRSRSVVETETGDTVALDKAAVETVRRLVGRKAQGVFSPLDGEAAQALLFVVESHAGHVGNIFEIRLPGRSILFLVSDHGLEFLAW